MTLKEALAKGYEAYRMPKSPTENGKLKLTVGQLMRVIPNSAATDPDEIPQLEFISESEGESK